jgi:hypothetical protein
MFWVCHRGEGIDNAETIEGAREIAGGGVWAARQTLAGGELEGARERVSAKVVAGRVIEPLLISDIRVVVPTE